HPEWIASARRALGFIRATMWREGRLLATWKDGRAHLKAYLDDYAFLLAAALELLQEFEDADAGGFYFTARDHEQLVQRPKPPHDNATPSGNAVAAWGLGRLAAITGEERYAHASERTLELFYPQMCDYPAGFAAMAIALDEKLQPPRTLILRGRDEALPAWQAELAREVLPGLTVLAVPDGMPGLGALLDKPARPEPVNAWL